MSSFNNFNFDGVVLEIYYESQILVTMERFDLLIYLSTHLVCCQWLMKNGSSFEGIY